MGLYRGYIRFRAQGLAGKVYPEPLMLFLLGYQHEPLSRLLVCSLITSIAVSYITPLFGV